VIFVPFVAPFFVIFVPFVAPFFVIFVALLRAFVAFRGLPAECHVVALEDAVA
jgi:hypothetical protein